MRRSLSGRDDAELYWGLHFALAMSHHVHPRASGPADVRRLGGALGLIIGLMAVEVVVGILASSLALLSRRPVESWFCVSSS